MGVFTTNFVLVCLVTCLLSVFANEHNNIYEKDDEVILWMSTVGLQNNSQVTYRYYSLPICRGMKDIIKHQPEKLAELQHHKKFKFSGLDIEYRVDVPKTEYCQMYLTVKHYKTLVYAVKNQYLYKMYLDNLPIAGPVGEADENNGQVSYYIWTHKKFDIGYNGKRIVDVNLTSEENVELTTGIHITLSYEVNWKRSSVKFQDRFDKYSNNAFLRNHDIRDKTSL